MKRLRSIHAAHALMLLVCACSAARADDAPPPPAYDALREYIALVDARQWGEDPAKAFLDAYTAWSAHTGSLRLAFGPRTNNLREWHGLAMMTLLAAPPGDERLRKAAEIMARLEQPMLQYLDAARVGSMRAVIDRVSLDLPMQQRPFLAGIVFNSRARLHSFPVEVGESPGAFAAQMRASLLAGDEDGMLEAAEACAALQGAVVHALREAEAKSYTPLLSGVFACVAESVSAPAAARLRDVVTRDAIASDKGFVAVIETQRLILQDAYWRLGFVMTRDEAIEYLLRTVFPPISVGGSRALAESTADWLREDKYNQRWPLIDQWFNAVLYDALGETAHELAPGREFRRLAEIDTPQIEPLVRDREMFLAFTAANRRMARTRRAAALLALRLAEHRASTGDWPARLADAAPEQETIDPVTGLSFEYERTPDGPRLVAPGRYDDYQPYGSNWVNRAQWEAWRVFLPLPGVAENAW